MTAVDKGNLKMHNKNRFTSYEYNYDNNDCALLSLRSLLFFKLSKIKHTPQLETQALNWLACIPLANTLPNYSTSIRVTKNEKWTDFPTTIVPYSL